MLGDAASSRPATPAPVVSPSHPEIPGSAISLLGVDYVHMKTLDGGDLYMTQMGLPFWENLLPENWYAAEWFETKRERLEGTSTVYKVPTRRVNGVTLHLVVKWSRVGEGVPLDTFTFNKFIHAEFNSPFEEFSLLMELRKGEAGPAGIRIRTQKPLAIYMPSERLQLWQTGRSEDKIRAKVVRHPGVEIDILRQYVVLYGWVKGWDAVETADHFKLQDRERAEFLARVTCLATHELWQKGYRVVDMKPAHIILRPDRNQSLLRDRNGQLVYALVDYELLERTPEHEQSVRSANRQIYLKHMARRFEADTASPLPAHLQRHQYPGRGLHFRPRRKHRRPAVGRGQGPGFVQLFPARTLAAHAEEETVLAQPGFPNVHQGQHQPGLAGFAHGRIRRGWPIPRATRTRSVNTVSTARSRNLPLRSN